MILCPQTNPTPLSLSLSLCLHTIKQDNKTTQAFIPCPVEIPQQLSSCAHSSVGRFFQVWSLAQNLTSSEVVGLLAYDPVTTVNVPDLEGGEEPADDGQGLVGDVMALCASDEESGTVPSHLIRVLEGEVGHVVERGGQVFDGDAESLLPIRPPHQVGQEELADGKAGLVFGEDGVCL